VIPVQTSTPPANVEALRSRLEWVESMLRDGDSLLAVDRELRFVYWGRRMESMSGIAADRALGREWSDMFRWGNSLDEAGVRAALAGHESSATDRPFRFPQSQGEGICEVRYLPWTDDGGRIIAAVALLRNRTEERRLAQRLEETETRFRNMADCAPVMLWMSGTDALCTFFNQTWLDFTGRTLAHELGVGWAAGVFYADFQRCMDTYLAAFNERRSFEMEYRLRRADGEWRWILDRGTPRWSPDGQFAGYIGSCVDITEHKRLEEELRKSLRDRDDFLSIASHELKTPLTTVKLAVDAMTGALRAHQDDPEAPPMPALLLATAARASTQTSRLAGLIEELLDMSRLAAGQLALGRSLTDLVTIVRDLVAHASDLAAVTQTPVHIDAPERAPGVWDRARLERALGNLLSNALKYGAGKPVRVAVHYSTESAEVSVVDQGIGIAEADQRRIFERFERAVSATHYGGFGLGLWIAREIVQAHGGEIHVSSRLGEGATFTIRLPGPHGLPAGGRRRRKGQSDEPIATLE
jgi:PAS domain S-box-containing protein